MFEYMGVIEEMGGQISSDWLPSKEDVLEWARVLGFRSGMIFAREVSA
jgi:hypothetical protein